PTGSVREILIPGRGSPPTIGLGQKQIGLPDASSSSPSSWPGVTLMPPKRIGNRHSQHTSVMMLGKLPEHTASILRDESRTAMQVMIKRPLIITAPSLPNPEIGRQKP